MNFAYVLSRSAIAAILAALALPVAPAAAAGGAGAKPTVTVAVLPSATVLSDLGAVEGMAPGLLSGGIGGVVPASQTYLDVSQGTRVFQHFYDDPLPHFLLTDDGVEPEAWREVVARAESAPADIVPGLLASTLAEQGLPSFAERRIGHAALIAADERGEVVRTDEPSCVEDCGAGVRVIDATRAELPRLVSGLRGDDLLIALRDPPPAEGRQLPIGIAGRGFEQGTLTSDSTRTDGFVLSIDLSSTILDRLGVEVPEEMSGRPIRAKSDTDVAALDELDLRLSERPGRGAVIGFPLLAWLLATGLAALTFRARGGRRACELLALSGVYLPTLLLVGAALKPTEAVEALVVGLGAPLAALVTLIAVRGYAALAVACAITVVAHAVDVVAGSPLTALSVLGPNPAGGVRFFGIGNELEAAIAVMVPLGVGAWLGSTREHSPRFAAAAFAIAAGLATLAFAPGRFGADVGAAIVLPAGAAVAVALVLRLSVRTTALALVTVVVGGVALLVLGDLVLGGDAHLSRTVLGADGIGEIADAIARRLRLTARSFYDPAYPALLVVALILLVLGYRARDRVLGWFGDRDAARAGFLAALAATVVGTISNDSGAILLIIGTIYLAISAGFFWARSAAAGRDQAR